MAELLARVGAAGGAVVSVGGDTLREWPAAAVAAMKSQGLLRRSRPATSVVCLGCEQECVMPVQGLSRTDGAARSFVVCDKRDDINRVPVPASRLNQWRCDADAVCAFIATSLRIRSIAPRPNDTGRREVGIAAGARRRQMLCLRPSPEPTIVVADSALPLADLMTFAGGKYSIDHQAIRDLVDAAKTADARHTPTTAKREVGRQETQARYEAWKKALRKLKREHPGKFDTWYARRIAKLPVAEGREAETIRRNMKG